MGWSCQPTIHARMPLLYISPCMHCNLNRFVMIIYFSQHVWVVSQCFVFLGMFWCICNEKLICIYNDVWIHYQAYWSLHISVCACSWFCRFYVGTKITNTFCWLVFCFWSLADIVFMYHSLTGWFGLYSVYRHIIHHNL